MVKQLLFAHSIPGHRRPMGRPHLTWMDTAVHDMGCLGHTLQADRPQASYGPGCVEGGGQLVLSFEQCFIFLVFLCFLRSLLGA